MRTSKIFRRTRKLIVVASFGLLLFGAIKQPTMTAYASTPPKQPPPEYQPPNNQFSSPTAGKAQAIPGEYATPTEMAILPIHGSRTSTAVGTC